MAPSIYEYRNTREWETAMAEWCAENEPRYAVQAINPDTLRVERKEFSDYGEAQAELRRAHYREWKAGLSCRAFIDTIYPTPVGNMPMKYTEPGKGRIFGCPAAHGSNLSGYREAGYKVSNTL